jgi:hypothetical protein
MMITMNAGRLRRAVLGGFAAAMLALPASAQTMEELDAVDAMATWLQGIDAGRVAASWDGLAPAVQGMITREAWEAAIRQGRAPFHGAVVSRQFHQAQPLPVPAGAPAGRYFRLAFVTEFERGGTATETVVTMNDGQRWWAGGYFIAPLPGERADYSAPAGAPYTAVDVTIPTPAGHTLAGTLTVPKNASGRVAVVVLISGSGAQDRDGGISVVPGYRFFRQVADTLGRRGIARAAPGTPGSATRRPRAFRGCGGSWSTTRSPSRGGCAPLR